MSYYDDVPNYISESAEQLGMTIDEYLEWNAMPGTVMKDNKVESDSSSDSGSETGSNVESDVAPEATDERVSECGSEDESEPDAEQVNDDDNVKIAKEFFADRPTVFHDLLLENPDLLHNFFKVDQQRLNDTFVNFLVKEPQNLECVLEHTQEALHGYLEKNPEFVRQHLLENPDLVKNLSKDIAEESEDERDVLSRLADKHRFHLNIYLKQNPEVVQERFRKDSELLHEHLLENPQIIREQLLQNPQTVQEHLRQHPETVQTYLRENCLAVEEFLNNRPGHWQGFLNDRPAELMNFLKKHPESSAGFVIKGNIYNIQLKVKIDNDPKNLLRGWPRLDPDRIQTRFPELIEQRSSSKHSYQKSSTPKPKLATPVKPSPQKVAAIEHELKNHGQNLRASLGKATTKTAGKRMPSSAKTIPTSAKHPRTAGKKIPGAVSKSVFHVNHSTPISAGKRLLQSGKYSAIPGKRPPLFIPFAPQTPSPEPEERLTPEPFGRAPTPDNRLRTPPPGTACQRVGGKCLPTPPSETRSQTAQKGLKTTPVHPRVSVKGLSTPPSSTPATPSPINDDKRPHEIFLELQRQKKPILPGQLRVAKVQVNRLIKPAPKPVAKPALRRVQLKSKGHVAAHGRGRYRSDARNEDYDLPRAAIATEQDTDTATRKEDQEAKLAKTILQMSRSYNVGKTNVGNLLNGLIVPLPCPALNEISTKANSVNEMSLMEDKMYAAAKWLLNKLEAENVTAADSLISYPAPKHLIEASRLEPNDGHWRLFEKDLIIQYFLEVNELGMWKGEDRFRDVARLLKSRDGIDRTWTSIKNAWNRGGRQRSGFDERKNKKAPMTSSLQGKEAATRNQSIKQLKEFLDNRAQDIEEERANRRRC